SGTARRRPSPSRSARARRAKPEHGSSPKIPAARAPPRAAGSRSRQNPAVAPAPTAVELHIVSDSTGETAARLVQALEAQFPDQPFEEVRHPRVESLDDLQIAVSRMRGRPAVAIYTLVEPEFR